MMPRIDRLFTLYFSRPLLRLIGNRKLGIPVLMYHSISDDPEPNISPYYRLTTPPARFKEHLLWLKDHRYTVIDLSEAIRCLGGKLKSQDRFVVLTFDDGYSDFLTQAFPILTQFGYVATNFLPTGFIGDIRKIFNGRECLTWAEVRKLRSAGIKFGTHTIHHVQLYSLEWTEIIRELEESKRELEDQLGEPVINFAYPYAYPQADRTFCNRLSDALLRCGYRCGVTTRIGRVSPCDDPLCLKRLPVNVADDLALFSAKTQGAYDWIALGQYCVKAWNYKIRAARANILGIQQPGSSPSSTP